LEGDEVEEAMRATPCASCGDRRDPVAIQAGRVVLCDSCTRAIAPWFFAATDEEVESFFGFAVPDRRSGLTRVASAQVHRDLASAYRDMGLSADASVEWALTATTSGEPHEAIARLLEPVIGRGTLDALARAVGLYLVARRTTAS
jgi:hypothetical protein